MEKKTIHYLALGDSYTIGEAVPAAHNFPNLLFQMANEEGIAMEKPRIIATTGWTTDELMKGIEIADEETPIGQDHDLVSLLAGVNDQYRGRPLEEYKENFRSLVQKALEFAGGNKEKLVILSIPDWGVTPFAEGRNRQQISKEIDAFNEASESIAKNEQIHYIYITNWTREATTRPELLASDGLHPSALEYERWSREILRYLKKL